MHTVILKKFYKILIYAYIVPYGCCTLKLAYKLVAFLY